MDVSVLGGDPDRTRIAVDGARINDAVDGGTQQNFSQEIVQEFQISTVNFDLSTGITAAGAINIVTRTGSNQLHGSGFFFFRDHHMSAYPGLQRDPLAPDPFFARRQSGVWVGGPIIKDKLFFFGGLRAQQPARRLHQRAHATRPSPPWRASPPAPSTTTWSTRRLDYRLNTNNTAFVRYSHDGNNTFAPREVNSMPSAWESNINWADSGVFSLISSIRPTLVNEFRYSTTFWSNHNAPPTADQCPDCLGLGGPARHRGRRGRRLRQPDQLPAKPPRAPPHLRRQHDLAARHATASNSAAKSNSSRAPAPTLWTHPPPSRSSPRRKSANSTPLSPRSCPRRSTPSATCSPCRSKNFTFGVGDVNQPPAFQRSQADHDRLFHFYWQDTWKLHAAPHAQLRSGLVLRKQRAQPRPHQAAIPGPDLRRQRPRP